jgi:hypothetical protein
MIKLKVFDAKFKGQEWKQSRLQVELWQWRCWLQECRIQQRE